MNGYFAGLLPTLFIAAIFVWMASEFIGGRIIPAWRARNLKQEGSAKSASLGVIFVCWFIAIIAVFIFRSHGLANLPVWLEYLGIILMFAGICIRQWAIAVLGRFFNVNVRLLKGHHVVTAGPYRFVRHPSYTGLIMVLVGVGLAGGSWESLLVMTIATTIALGYRIRVEERFLIKRLGSEYVEYRKYTKYLVPFML